SGFCKRNPGVFASTTKVVIPLVPLLRSVMVKRTMASATGPFVIQFLVPLMTYLSPRRTAVVRCSAASLPACGSVRPKQPSFAQLNFHVAGLWRRERKPGCSCYTCTGIGANANRSTDRRRRPGFASACSAGSFSKSGSLSLTGGLRQQVASDHHALDLRGALVDL